MVTALYRRYRPDTFADLIGQEQVTGPLTTALRTNRVNHAYLFSGPRGCGKTTSARILARCLNCAEGPTDTPCGVCASCVELATGGSGSLDVVEIDAASHNGVEDARDLRERAAFAPARDRYKIFILDEAHMVTVQGFNAMLKLVEEPPEHVKFIFATTEPDKVIGTIRSRTHHYPFKLVPPATMLPFLEKILATEGISAEPGVLPLAIRAGGGSVRDTLSVLDQVVAGSDAGGISYQRTISLLGYTPTDLLDQVIDALSQRNASTLFAGVDRVIQTGQDPRRFVEDLLERTRDLILLAAAGEAAQSVLRGATEPEVVNLSRQAQEFGAAQLVRAASVINESLTEMSGVTSPRIHLELMCARLLLPESDDTSLGTLSRLDRLERRVGVEGGVPSTPAQDVAGARQQQGTTVQAKVSSAETVEASPEAIVSPPVQQEPEGPRAEQAATATVSDSAAVDESRQSAETEASGPVHPQPAKGGKDVPTPANITLDQLRDAWAQILEHVGEANRMAWIVVSNAQAIALTGDILTLSFVSRADAEAFKNPQTPHKAPEVLRKAILDVLGLRVKYLAKVHSDIEGSTSPASAAPTAEPQSAEPSHVPPVAAQPPHAEPPQEPPTDSPWPEEPPVDEYEPAPSPQTAAAPTRSTPRESHTAQYGEAVIRERLKAVPLDENGSR